MRGIILSWTLVLGFVASFSAGATKDAGTVFCLKSFDPIRPRDGRSGNGLLTRDNARQRILIAARDGLALSARDEAVRESLTGGDPLSVHAQRLDDKLHVFIDF